MTKMRSKKKGGKLNAIKGRKGVTRKRAESSPPQKVHCDVCGRSIKKLEPFDGHPFKYKGKDKKNVAKLLIKTRRPAFPYPDFIREVNTRFREEKGIGPQSNFVHWYNANYYHNKPGTREEKARRFNYDFHAWCIATYGEDGPTRIREVADAWKAKGPDGLIDSWECRDCIALGEDEYFEKIRKEIPGRRD